MVEVKWLRIGEKGRKIKFLRVSLDTERTFAAMMQNAFRDHAARALAFRAAFLDVRSYRLLDWRLDNAFERRFVRCSVSVVRGCFLTYLCETKRPSTAFRSKVISVSIAWTPFCGSLNFAESRRAMLSNHLGYAFSKHYTSGLS
jgi:hypothetical protein